MKYVVKKELMCGKEYFMIYKKFLFFLFFYERWNTFESSNTRLKELNK